MKSKWRLLRWSRPRRCAESYSKILLQVTLQIWIWPIVVSRLFCWLAQLAHCLFAAIKDILTDGEYLVANTLQAQSDALKHCFTEVDQIEPLKNELVRLQKTLDQAQLQLAELATLKEQLSAMKKRLSDGDDHGSGVSVPYSGIDTLFVS